MASDWEVTCAAIRDEILANVPALAEAETHTMVSWDPEALDPADGKKHLAVWPAGEGEASETADYLVTGGDEVEQSYVVLIWEPAGDQEGDRWVRDEAAAAVWFQLHNDVRARFYVTSNLQLGGASPMKYRGAEFPSQVSRARWMAIYLTATKHQAFTP
jgi:hypothetical protein